MKVVTSDRDQRLAVGAHIVLLKKGKNEVPDGLAPALAEFPGVTTPGTKQKAEPES